MKKFFLLAFGYLLLSHTVQAQGEKYQRNFTYVECDNEYIPIAVDTLVGVWDGGQMRIGILFHSSRFTTELREVRFSIDLIYPSGVSVTQQINTYSVLRQEKLTGDHEFSFPSNEKPKGFIIRIFYTDLSPVWKQGSSSNEMERDMRNDPEPKFATVTGLYFQEKYRM